MSRLYAIGVVGLLVAQAALAVNYTYSGDGAGTYNWNTAASWGGAGVPNSFSDTVYFSGAAAQWIKTETGAPFKFGGMTLGNGLGRTTVIKIGYYKGSPGLEAADGATITKKDSVTDQMYATMQLDGATTFNITAGMLTTAGITGTGSLIKDGAGNLNFDALPNAYTGQTWVKSGQLYLNGPVANQLIGAGGLKMTGGILHYISGDHILDTAPIEMGGGAEWNTSFSAEMAGTFTLAGDAKIWGTAGGILRFANSSAAAWASGSVLTLTAESSSVPPIVYFGTNTTGLTADQLTHLRFVDGVTGATYAAGWDPSNTGLVVPITHTYWSADFNHDLVVNFKDYIVLEGNFGKTNATNVMGDSNGDGTVNFKDYIDLEGQFGKTSTPEPATVGLLVASIVPLLRRRK